MNEGLQRAHDMLANLFAGMPPAVVVAASLILLAAALWFSHHALHRHRIVNAVANAPLADLCTDAAGLVKLRGTAQVPSVQTGKSASGILWYSRSSRSVSNSSTLETTHNFLIRDGHGTCAVETAKTEIFPTRHAAEHALPDNGRSSVEKTIHSGDPVFGLGELRRGLPVVEIRRRAVRLRQSRAPRQGAPHAVVPGALAARSAVLGCAGLRRLDAHRQLPSRRRRCLSTFLDTLRTSPLRGRPGVEHPLWDKQTPRPER